MWKDYLRLAKTYKVSAEWVRGHYGYEENVRCDEIARGEAENLKGKDT
jgi:ribonuclease HI